MNKRGSHVGVVVSFVIFVTFLIFLYTMLQPITVKERGREYILDYLTLNLLGEATGNMTSMLITVLESTGNQDCIDMQDFPEIPENQVENLLIKDSEDVVYAYQVRPSGNVWIDTGKNFIGILRVYYGDDVERSPQGVNTGCNPKPYAIGYIRVFSEIFGEKIYELNESYYVDYEGLKAHLGIPEDTEFNFYVLDGQRSDPPIIKAALYPTPTDRSVYVEETPIQYLDEDGNMLFGFLLVEIW